MIYERLIRRGLMSSVRLQELERRAEGVTVEELLLADGVPKHELLLCLAAHYHVPFVEFDESVVASYFLIIPLDLEHLKKHLWFPLSRRDGRAEVIVCRPDDHGVAEDIMRTLGVEQIDFRIALPADLLKSKNIAHHPFLYFSVLAIGTVISLYGLLIYLNVRKSRMAPPGHQTLVEVTGATVQFLENYHLIENSGIASSTKGTMLSRMGDFLVDYSTYLSPTPSSKTRTMLARERNVLAALPLSIYCLLPREFLCWSTAYSGTGRSGMNRRRYPGARLTRSKRSDSVVLRPYWYEDRTETHFSNVMYGAVIILIGFFAFQNMNLVLTKLRFVEIADDLNASFLEMRLLEKNYFLYRDRDALDGILNAIETTANTINTVQEDII